MSHFNFTPEEFFGDGGWAERPWIDGLAYLTGMANELGVHLDVERRGDVERNSVCGFQAHFGDPGHGEEYEPFVVAYRLEDAGRHEVVAKLTLLMEPPPRPKAPAPKPRSTAQIIQFPAQRRVAA